jgi:CelD/BcsL family acetyltransferase involved in cellulose biosynthesis
VGSEATGRGFESSRQLLCLVRSIVLVKIDFISTLSQEDWQSFLNQVEEASIFHTFEWSEVLTQTYPHYQKMLIIAEERGELLGFLPLIIIKQPWYSRRYYSLPFGTYGGALLKKGVNEKVREEILKKFNQLTGKFFTRRLEVVDFFHQNSFLEKLNFKKRKLCTLIIRLDQDLRKIWRENLSPETRNQTRQAQKYGVGVEEVDSFEKIKVCYQMVEELNKRRQIKKSLYPFELLVNIYKIMKRKGLVKWLIARQGGEFLSYSLNFSYQKNLMGWLNASFKRYWSLRPNNALYWHLIEWGNKNGYQELNIGAISEEAKGLLHFKKQWGGEEKYYYLYSKRRYFL